MELYQNAEWLREQYIVKKKSLAEMAEKAGCCMETIRYWMIKHRVPIRTRSEQLRLRWERGDFGDEMRRLWSDRIREARARGDYDSEKTRCRLAESQRKLWRNEAYRRRQLEAFEQRDWSELRKVCASPEHRQKMTEVNNRCWEDESRRQHMSDVMRSRWRRGKMDDIFQGPTSIELETASALDALKIAYRGQYRPHDCSYIYDFLVFPNVLVETNGEYWHSLPNAVERDTNKASWALDHGYELVTLWEKAINTCGAYSLVVYLVLPVIDYEGTWFEQLSFHFESGR